jgi:flavin-dependent dehydrogenase
MIECDVAVVGAGPAGCSAARVCISMGLKTVIVERKRMPRHKACSGILIPDSVAPIKEFFGELPDDVMAHPPNIRAMRMHFPGGRCGDIPVNGLLVWRDRLDAWMCAKSGAEILDSTALKSFVEMDDAVNLACLNSRREDVSVVSQIMIAADGGSSFVVKTLQPEIAAQSVWYFALQDTYECRNDLEPGYFHFYCIPEVSLYSSAYTKDGLLIMDVVVREGDNPTSAMSRFRDFLWKEINVRGENRLRRLGCKVTYAAPKGLFCFGTDRILVCGEASGLLNLFGEGISSAIASGVIAGKASVRAVHESIVPGGFYKKDIEYEKLKTQQTFEYRKIFFHGKGAFNFKKGIGFLTWKDRLLFFQNLLLWMWRLKR